MPQFTGDLDCPYQRTDNGYPRYLDTIVDNIKDEVACEVQCTFYENFVCRSFAYYASANQCFISGDDRGMLDLIVKLLPSLDSIVYFFIVKWIYIKVKIIIIFRQSAVIFKSMLSFNTHSLLCSQFFLLCFDLIYDGVNSTTLYKLRYYSIYCSIHTSFR